VPADPPPGFLVALAPEELGLAARRLAVQQALEAGELQPLGRLRAADRPEAQYLAPRPVPRAYAELVTALDLAAERVRERDPARAASLSYEAASVYAAHDCLDEARVRLETVLAGRPDEGQRLAAMQLLLELHLARQDWEQVAAWSQELAARALEPDERARLLALGPGARRRAAEEQAARGRRLWAEGLRDEAAASLASAADGFLALADTWPEQAPGLDPRARALPEMLHEAAECYALAERSELAGRASARLARDFPSHPLADRALFLEGQTALGRGDFRAAARTWLALVAGHAGSELRAEALLKAAVALERAGDAREAAAAFERWAELYPDAPEAADTFLRAGEALERHGDWAEALASRQRFLARHKARPEQAERVVWALYRAAEAELALGRPDRARLGYLAVLKLGRGLRLPAGGRGARAMAGAEARLAEPR
jgi:TolA-binding protein